MTLAARDLDPRVVFLAHPLSGDIEGNLERAQRWYEYFLMNYRVAIIADWIITSFFLNDAIPEHRERGLRASMSLVLRADAVWLCGPYISGGMRDEAQLAFDAGIPVRNLTLGELPPREVIDIAAYPFWTPHATENWH